MTKPTPAGARLDAFARDTAGSFRFEPESHTYHRGDLRLPSVTQIIRRMTDLANVPPAILERKRQIGEVVHQVIQYDCDGDLDPFTVDPVVMPYFEAWRAFVDETGWAPEVVEQPMQSTRFDYAGTPDQVGTLSFAGEHHPTVLDTKTVFHVEQHVGLQLAGYEQLLREASWPPCRRVALQLRPDGTYSLHEFKSPLDRPCFLGLRAVYQWEAHEGITR